MISERNLSEGVDSVHRRAHTRDMTTTPNPDPAEVLRSIRENAKFCPTCGATPNPENFGGMCDPCDTKARERRARVGRILADARKAQGVAPSYEDRYLIAAGKRAEAEMARR